MINTKIINERSLKTAATYLNNINKKGFLSEKLRVVIPTKDFKVTYNIEQSNLDEFFTSSDQEFCSNGWVLKLINIYVNCVIFDGDILKYRININDDYSLNILRLNPKEFTKIKVDRYERLLLDETLIYIEKIKLIESDRLIRLKSNNYINECYFVLDYIN